MISHEKCARSKWWQQLEVAEEVIIPKKETEAELSWELKKKHDISNRPVVKTRRHGGVWAALNPIT